jgi:hypothetical protein
MRLSNDFSASQGAFSDLLSAAARKQKLPHKQSAWASNNNHPVGNKKVYAGKTAEPSPDVVRVQIKPFFLMKSIRNDALPRAKQKLLNVCKVEKLIKNSVPLGEIYGDTTGGIEQRDQRLN